MNKFLDTYDLPKLNQEDINKTGKMAWQAKAPAARPDNLTSNHRTHMVGGKRQLTAPSTQNYFIYENKNFHKNRHKQDEQIY